MHRPALARSADRVAWLLDDVWPETASMVEALIGPNDQLLAPGILPGFPARYDWPARTFRLAALLPTIARHWAMRRVAQASGAIRQQSYLEHDRAVAQALAKAIDYRARHLVVAQAWLPWLDQAGALGGRTFDVVMSRYPLADIHHMLDEAAAELGPSATIADFRADAEFVAAESELLARAGRIITPHHGIAALFPRRAQLLAWHRPPAGPAVAGTRVAFLGPTLARQRPDVAARLAVSLEQPLIVFGAILETLWGGTAIERRAMGADWLNGIGAILHPAAMTHQPRALLEAVANGVSVYATPACGLAPSDYLPLDCFAEAGQASTPLVTSAVAG